MLALSCILTLTFNHHYRSDFFFTSDLHEDIIFHFKIVEQHLTAKWIFVIQTFALVSDPVWVRSTHKRFQMKTMIIKGGLCALYNHTYLLNTVLRPAIYKLLNYLLVTNKFIIKLNYITEIAAWGRPFKRNAAQQRFRCQ